MSELQHRDVLRMSDEQKAIDEIIAGCQYRDERDKMRFLVDQAKEDKLKVVPGEKTKLQTKVLGVQG